MHVRPVLVAPLFCASQKTHEPSIAHQLRSHSATALGILSSTTFLSFFPPLLAVALLLGLCACRSDYKKVRRQRCEDAAAQLALVVAVPVVDDSVPPGQKMRVLRVDAVEGIVAVPQPETTTAAK